MDEEEIKNIVIQGYRDILKRDPDPGGLQNYIDEIKNGLGINSFHNILRMSDEYIQKFGNQQPEGAVLMPQTITYCMMGTNRLHEIKGYIETVLSYVHRFIFIDGGSTDGTVEYLRSLNPNFENKIEIYVHEWQDKFSAQRNNYLKHFTERQDSGWILVSDTDEHFPPDTLSKLKEITKNADVEGFNGIQFQVEDVALDDDDDDREKILNRNVNQYWKALMFRYYPGIHYEGEPHERLVGAPIRWKKMDFIYQHFRSQKKIYERACENFFISNSNRYSTKWSEFRFLCTKNNILPFKDFFKLYKEGSLSTEIEDWIYNHRDDNQDAGDSEVREMAKLYFEILYPDKRQTNDNTLIDNNKITENIK